MKIKTILLSLAVMLAVPSALAQVRFGVKGGVAVNSLKLNNEVFYSDNRTGWTAGAMVDLKLPLTGLSLDGSLMYTHRSEKLYNWSSDSEIAKYSGETYSRNFLEIPVHIKYGISIPVVSKVFVPYLLTGPNFSVLFSDTDQDIWSNHSFNTAWDFGVGVELINHLQLQAAYSLGINKNLKGVIPGTSSDEPSVKGRDRCWTITAAYLF